MQVGRWAHVSAQPCGESKAQLFLSLGHCCPVGSRAKQPLSHSPSLGRQEQGGLSSPKTCTMPQPGASPVREGPAARDPRPTWVARVSQRESDPGPGPGSIRSRPHLCSPYIPGQASQTRALAKWPLGLCSLTIFSQAGEKIACQLGRGWPATGNRVGAPTPLTAGPGPRLPASSPPGPSPRASHRCPCPAIPLLFLAQPSTEAPRQPGQTPLSHTARS